MKVSRIHSRRLLQELSGDSMDPTLAPEPLLKNTSISVSNTPFKINSPFDSSMALTVLILLSFLFLMGFFSVYIRRYSDQETEVRRRRNSSPASRLVVKKKGVDSSTISALPLISYKGCAKQGIIEECTICLGEFQEGEMVKLIPNCRHVFHPTCIDTWLESHVSCPLCRCSQLLKNEKNGGDELRERSTAEDRDTSVEVVGSSEISGLNLGKGRIMLHRSSSF